MSKVNENDKTSRRNFLKMASVSAPAAAAAVALSGTEALATEAEGTKSGLQDTAHTRAYYDSVKF